MSGDDRCLRARRARAGTTAKKVVLDGIPIAIVKRLGRRPFTPSATPARTARSRCPRDSSRERPSNAGRTARQFSLVTGKPRQPAGVRAGSRLRVDDHRRRHLRGSFEDARNEEGQLNDVNTGDHRPPGQRRDRPGHQAHPQGRRPDHRTRAEIHADHGAERIGQVDPGLHDRRASASYHVDGRIDHARRRRRAEDDRGRTRPRRAVPRDAVPGRDPRRDRVELPAHRQDRDRRRGARHPRLDNEVQGVDGRAAHGQGVRRAQRQRGVLRRREEAPRDPSARAAQAEVRRARRDRFRAGRRRAQDRRRKA